ncbi:MAG: hypothetical protein AB1779_05955 [Candidatus Thermoplasmatota archaeon]
MRLPQETNMKRIGVDIHENYCYGVMAEGNKVVGEKKENVISNL